MRIDVSNPAAPKAKGASRRRDANHRPGACCDAHHASMRKIPRDMLSPQPLFDIRSRQAEGGKLTITGRETMNFSRTLFAFTLAASAGVISLMAPPSHAQQPAAGRSAWAALGLMALATADVRSVQRIGELVT